MLKRDLEFLVDEMGATEEEWEERFQDGDLYVYPNCWTYTDFAVAYCEETSLLQEVPAWISMYIDYEKMGRDILILENAVWDKKTGKVYLYYG
jgi:antirestriction protein